MNLLMRIMSFWTVFNFLLTNCNVIPLTKTDIKTSDPLYLDLKNKLVSTPSSTTQSKTLDQDSKLLSGILQTPTNLFQSSQQLPFLLTQQPNAIQLNALNQNGLNYLGSSFGPINDLSMTLQAPENSEQFFDLTQGSILNSISENALNEINMLPVNRFSSSNLINSFRNIPEIFNGPVLTNFDTDMLHLVRYIRFFKYLYKNRLIPIFIRYLQELRYLLNYRSITIPLLRFRYKLLNNGRFRLNNVNNNNVRFIQSNALKSLRNARNNYRNTFIRPKLQTSFRSNPSILPITNTPIYNKYDKELKPKKIFERTNE